VSTARASPVVNLINLFSLPLSLAASVLKAYPVVSPVANLTDVHVMKGGHICFRLKAEIPEANPTASALNGRASHWMGSLRREASL